MLHDIKLSDVLATIITTLELGRSSSGGIPFETTIKMECHSQIKAVILCCVLSGGGGNYLVLYILLYIINSMA